MNKENLELFEKLKNEEKNIKENVKYIISCFKYEEKKNRLSQLQLEMNSNSNFWDDVENAQKITKEVSFLEKTIAKIKKLIMLEDDFVNALILVDADESFIHDSKDIYEQITSLIEEMKIEATLSEKYDNNKAIVSITAGAGGTEAQDWSNMLFRMYQMYSEKNGFKMEVLDYQAGDVAGIKGVTFSIEGAYAYGFLKCEMGVHRRVRISPFDSGARRHTSFASVEVTPEIEEDNEIIVKDEDIRIDTYRASGAGGQHINKTDSAVRITHFPSGIVVTCQNERSQIQNKEKAMQVLKSKLLQIKIDEDNKKLQEMKGDVKKIEWGSQIRSYIFCPYTLVKDHRTNFENTNVQAVMDGEIQPFIDEYLRKTH